MSTDYDEVVYPNRPFAVTQPSRLGVLPAIFGLDYGPPEACSVLEIACGDGGNIIPMAAAWPGSTFVGFDLAASRIAAGQEAIGGLGLGNIRLEVGDLMEVDLGRFDYVIAHGVYAWVPEPVRDGLMALIARSLTPRGVAYVSYNALPGCLIRRQIRDMLLIRLQGVAGSAARLEVAQDFLRMLSETLDEEEPRQAAVRHEATMMLRRPPEVIFHDELCEHYAPVHVYDFIHHARRHGLQYLGDTEPRRLEPGVPNTPGAHALVDPIVGDEPRLQQYIDFLSLDTFRRTVLRRGDAPIERVLDSFALKRLYVSAAVSRDPETPDGYRFASGSRLQSRDARLTGLLDRLSGIWPQALPIADLDEAMLPTLLRLHLAEMVELEAAPSPFVCEPGERPRAAAVARWQAAAGHPELTTLHHRQLDVPDDDARRFIGLLDGTRSRPELSELMAPRLGPSAETLSPALAAQLSQLARAGLLEA